MKKILPLFLLTSSFLAALDEDYMWAKKELSMLFNGYKKYLAASEKERLALDLSLADLKPVSLSFTLSGTGEKREIPAFRFFTLVDPVTGDSAATAAEKTEAAARDYGMADAFIAMTALLEQNPDSRALAVDTQKLMLGWALRAANKKTPSAERKSLSAAFAFMVSEIGNRPALLNLMPVYRTRRVFTLETPEAAAEEAARVEALVKEISSS